MSNLVSPCCGAEYSDVDEYVSNCCGAYFLEPGFPDNEICTSCGEHADAYEYECTSCYESFQEPELDYEYKEQMKESIAEDRMDEARDMGIT